MSDTILKDPVYGYVKIEEEIVEIIDTPNFQRLRDIIQTSYDPLFHNSIHSRFSHSLGVYYLGRMAIKSLLDNFRKKHGPCELSEEKERNIKDIFLKACLLHDIGHSPFSHTGEYFYLDEKVNNDDDRSSPKLIADLKKLLDDQEFINDIEKQQFCDPKPHEYMSAYLGLKNFSRFFKSEDASFFVRCIIGLQYYCCKDVEKQLKNACIELLNSSTIDVDKLDYLIRDIYMTGFNSINIDYERLLAGVSINELEEGIQNNIISTKNNAGTNITTTRHIFVAFKKAAISVLENVILANDLERQWIQSHPVVLYGAFLLRVIIQNINKSIIAKQQKHKKNIKSLFSYDSLTVEGVDLMANAHMRLLSDSDILYLAKNYFYDEWVEEYFSRNDWRHPLWKSQAEFQLLMNKNNIETLQNVIFDIEKDLLSGEYNTNCINSKLLKAYKKQFENAQNAIKECGHNSSIDAVSKKLESKIKLLEFLDKYCKKNKNNFDFVVINIKQFTSGMNKEDFKNITIQFDALGKNCCLNEALPMLKSEIVNDNYFYMYNKVVSNSSPIDVENFCRELVSQSNFI